MRAPPDTPAARIRRLAGALAVLAVAGVAVGAASRRPGVAFEGEISPDFALLATEATVAAAAGVALVVAVEVLALLLRRPDPWRLRNLRPPAPRKRLPWPITVLVSMIPIVLAVLLIVALTRNGGLKNLFGGGLALPFTAKGPARPGASGGEMLLMTVALLFGAALAIGLLRAPRPIPGPATARDEAPLEPLAEILDDGLAALEAEGEPRRAIIAAYAVMERSMARHGLARRAEEAPTEYLRRVFSPIAAGAADLRRLTELFTLARFSEHPISEAMRRQAIESVVRLHDRVEEMA